MRADHGATRVRVNDDVKGDGRHQYLPRLSVAPSGRLDVIFYDRRDDPENMRNHVYYTYSTDGGRTFAANHRLTSQSFYSDTGSGYPTRLARGLIEFGGRIALLSSGSGAVAAWTDTRLVPRFLAHQDIFATRVEASNRATLSPEARRGLAGAVVACLALLAMAARRWHLRRNP